MRRQHKRVIRCVGCAAIISAASFPLTSCDSRAANADTDSVGYVAIVSSHKGSGPAVERAVNTVPAPQAAVPVQPPAEPLGAVPPYTVIAQRTSDRPDKATTYYVVLGAVDPAMVGGAPVAGLTEPVQMLGEGQTPAELVAEVAVPVDTATSAFKPAVKQVLRSLASVNGGSEFTAHIWDEVTAAQTEVSYKSAPDLFSDEQYAAKEIANARHLVGSYQGGIGQAGQSSAYVLFWFPDGGTENLAGGNLMSSEVWRP